MNSLSDKVTQVLLIDDDVILQETVQAACELHDIEIICCKEGTKAVGLFSELNPRVALIDYRMPEMTGIEIGKNIRSLPNGANVFMVLLTGHLNAPIAADAQKIGFDQVLRKPISMKSLITMLKSLSDNAA